MKTDCTVAPYPCVDHGDARPDYWEGGRDLAIRVSRLRRPYWRFLTALARKRCYLQLIERVLHLDGDVAECGVFRGRTLLRLAMTVDRHTKSKTIHGFDSFCGFPGNTVSSTDLGPGRTMSKVKRRFVDAGSARDRIERVAADLGLNIELHAGFFQDTLPKALAGGRRFCFVHLDCDLYESYRTCLKLLYDAVVPGGILLFDEYRCPVWPGATQAVDEFFADKIEKPVRCEDRGHPDKPKYFVVKQ